MGGGRESLKDPSLSQEQRASANSENATFLAGIFLLKASEGLNELYGLKFTWFLGFKDLIGSLDATDDNKDVIFANVFMCGLI